MKTQGEMNREEGLYQAFIAHDDGGSVVSKEEAQRVVPAGWVVEEAEDAELGLWLVRLPQEAEELLEREGFIQLMTSTHHIEIEMP